MELLKVKLEDVYPDENNPREAFDGIDELAASFDLNAERPGEPFTPPLLVRDGGIYRIVDGERRYRALLSRGAKECWANVCDGMDEADAVAAMLATDDKAQLTDLEKSRGVQRMLLLGVDPEKVEKAGRFKGAEKVAAVMAKADDAAEDLTLDRALAASEFLDDDDAFEQLMTCKESDWRWKAESLKRERANAARKAGLVSVLEAHGVEIIKKMDYSKWDRHGSYKKPEELEAALDELDPALGVPFGWVDLRPGADIYFARKDGSGEVDAEAEKRAEVVKASFNEAFSQIRSFFWSNIASKSGRDVTELKTIAFDRFKSDVLYDSDPEGELDGFPDLVPENPSLMDLALGYSLAFPWEEIPMTTARSFARGDGNYYAVPDMADLFRAAEADGFEFGDGALPAKEAVEAFMAGGDGDGDE